MGLGGALSFARLKYNSFMTGVPFNIATITISILALVVAILAARYGRAALFPAKRELRIYWMPPAPLVGSNDSRVVSVLVEIDNRVLKAPYLTHVEIHVGGRHDIKSSDFDQNKPILLNFGTPVALAASSSFLAEALASEGDRIIVTPSLLRRGTQHSFDVVTEAAPTVVTASEHLIDTKVTTLQAPSREEYWQKEQRRWAALSIACALMTAALIALNFYTIREWENSTERLAKLFEVMNDVCGF